MLVTLAAAGATPSTVIEAVLYAMGTATLTAAFLALVWRIVRPHVAAWVRGLLAPMAHDTRQVVEAAANANEAASSADAKLDQVVTGVERLNQRVRVIDGRSLNNAAAVSALRRLLAAHIRESNEILARLRAHSLDLPDDFTETPND